MRRPSGFQALFLLIVIALLAGNIYFGIGYYRDGSSKGALSADLAAVEAQIDAFEQTYDIEELQAYLTNLLQQLEEAPFPMDVEDNVIYDHVRTAAEEAGAHIDSWTEGDVTDEAVNGSQTEYRLFSYETTVSGTLDEIFDFLAGVEENPPYETIKMDEVELAYDSDTLIWSMTFYIQVYAQPE